MDKIDNSEHQKFFDGIDNAAKEWFDSRNKYEPFKEKLSQIQNGEVHFPRRRLEVMPNQLCPLDAPGGIEELSFKGWHKSGDGFLYQGEVNKAN